MSQRDSGYERVSGDRYFTPAWVTEALLGVECFDGVVWDPAAGDGHIVACFGQAFGTDIIPNLSAGISERDFTLTPDVWQFGGSHIVTNPPYGKGGRMAVLFIRHALAFTQHRNGKVAMLLRVDFDSANGRRDIFNDHPAFAAKYALTKRIRWANLEQKKGSGPSENHAWFVWSWSRGPNEPRKYGYLP